MGIPKPGLGSKAEAPVARAFVGSSPTLPPQKIHWYSDNHELNVCHGRGLA